MAVRGSGSARPPGSGYDRAALEGLSVSERMARIERLAAHAGGSADNGNWREPTARDEGFDDYGFGAPGGRSASRGGSGRPPGNQRGSRRRGLLISGGVGAVVVIGLALLALTGTVTLPGMAAAPVPTVGFSPNAADAGSPADQTGDAFLADWQSGKLATAAKITDNPSAALAALTMYKKDLNVSGMTLSPGSATAAGWLTFSVTAQVGNPASAWTYSSGLATYQGTSLGQPRWFVKWNPNLLFTSLTAGEHLALGSVPATSNQVVDNTGAPITSANAPSLTNIVTDLEQNTTGSGGTPGQSVEIVNAAGAVVSTVTTVSQPISGGPVKTTINLTDQAAAQSAVDSRPNSSMVILQPSTGDILAIANNPPNGLDTAMVGQLAPGSTFKMITSTMLFTLGLVTSVNQVVPCPQYLHADGIVLHNAGLEQGPNNTFLLDFAQSCNNAFSSFYNKATNVQLANTAQTYYGLNEPWNIGLGAEVTYGTVPDGANNAMAEELVGQDKITMSPLVMAAVAAAIDNGSFEQPILVPGTKQVTTTPLPPATDASIKTAMHAVVTNPIGTLYGVFSNTNNLYGKTGSAEDGSITNAWTVAFRGNFAFCGFVYGGGYGSSAAGPEVNSALNAIDP